MTNTSRIITNSESSLKEEKTVWRIALGPPQEQNAPFRRLRNGKTYASVAADMATNNINSIKKNTSPQAQTQAQPVESRGKQAFLKGGKFENDLGKILVTLCDIQTGEPLLNEYIASDAPAENEDFLVQWRGKTIGLEAKNFGTSEGGQRAFALQEDRLVIPNLPRNRIHRACLPLGFVPFEGRIPSFKKGDLTRETWDKERELFRDQHIRCSSNAIADYYRMKGSSYIQIQGMGLYHTGQDVCGWGVPLFTCPTHIRIRCKTHKGNVPTTVQAALNYRKERLQKSPYCLVSGPLPSSLQLKA